MISLKAFFVQPAWFMIFFLFLTPLALHGQSGGTAFLELAWESEEKAEYYEVEVRSADKEKNLVKTFKTSKTSLQKKIPAGEYLLRIRSVSEDGAPGDWSAPVSFRATSPEIEAITPSAGEKVVATKGPRQRVRFRWKEKDYAQSYLLKVWQKDSSRPRSFITREASKSILLEIGRSYAWQVSIKDKSGVVYEAQSPAFRFSIIGERLAKPEVKEAQEKKPPYLFRWAKVPKAQSYGVGLFRRDLLGEKWSKIPLDQNTGDDLTALKIERALAPGEYRLELIAKAKNHVSSEKSLYRFVIKPKLEELLSAR